jgi:RNA exonuclease 1
MGGKPHGNPENRRNKRKRHHGFESSSVGMGSTLPLLQQPDIPAFNLTSERFRSEQGTDSRHADIDNQQEWQTVEHQQRKKPKKIPKPNSDNYPVIAFSTQSSRLQSQIKISDLQNLVLYLLADGTSPQWIAVRNRNHVRKVVVLMVPGLERDMFAEVATVAEDKQKQDGGKSGQRAKEFSSPDTYYPIKLSSDKLPTALKPFADVFDLLWPVKTPGDDKYGKMHSPLHAMLTAPLSRREEDRSRKGAKPAREPQGWQDKRTRVTEYITSAEDLLENEYTLHPAIYSDQENRIALEEQRRREGKWVEDGWVDTLITSFDEGTAPESEIEKGSVTAGREVIAMDCEMCMTGENEFSLTRISLVGWDGTVVLDELVKPDKPIIDYVTRYV